jgi:hypothetical protein
MTIQHILIITVLFVLCGCSKSNVEKASSSAKSSDTPQTSQTLKIPKKSASNSTFTPTSKTLSELLTMSNTSKKIDKDRIQGKVIETMDSGGYTYVSIKTNTGKALWVAGPKSSIKVGDLLDVKKDMEMNNFTSNTLGRTFSSIYFVSSFQDKASTQAKRMPKSLFPSISKLTSKSRASSRTHEPTLDVSSHTHGSISGVTGNSNHAFPSSSPSTKISISKAKGGYTIAEIFAKSDLLAGKEVLVRGQVVKFNEGIMEKNWIHIQDGTGNITDKTYDLTITCNQTTSVGQTILVKGILAKDKDIGAGYKYPVLLEKATVTTK